MCWWPNLARLEKPDYPVWETRVSGFASFKIGSKNEVYMKIWRSKYVWSIEKDRRNIKEPTHVLTTNFNILGKPECRICQTKTSRFYSYEMVNISKWRPTLYISQVEPCRHVFQVMHMFLRQFSWISLKKQRSASNYQNMNSNSIFEASMMNPLLRWSKWIYGTHDLELAWESYGISKILQDAKSKVPVWETGVWFS
jgi:hypothetical protein